MYIFLNHVLKTCVSKCSTSLTWKIKTKAVIFRPFQWFFIPQRVFMSFLWSCLIDCCRDSEEEKIAKCCQLPWLCRIFERSCPNWCNLRHTQAPDRPDNSFYWRRNLFHARILQKCPQECKIRLYHLIGCYQWPFPSAWCFNRTVLTSRPRLRWYIFQSTDDKKWWR